MLLQYRMSVKYLIRFTIEARLQNTRPLTLNLKSLIPQSHSQSIIYSQSVTAVKRIAHVRTSQIGGPT